MLETVLIYIEQNNSYLMLYRNKKKNDYNHGKYIGIGGRIESNETKEQALLREVKEETGLTLLSYSYRGKIYFKDTNTQEIMYLYTSNEFAGDLLDCDEGELTWININKIFSLPIWEGDKVFLDLLKQKAPYFELELIYENGNFVKSKQLL